MCECARVRVTVTDCDRDCYCYYDCVCLCVCVCAEWGGEGVCSLGNLNNRCFRKNNSLFFLVIPLENPPFLFISKQILEKSDVKFENFEIFSNYALVFVAYILSLKLRVFGLVLVFGRRSVA